MQIQRVNPSQRRAALARLMTDEGRLTDEQFARLDDYVRQTGVDYRHLWAGYTTDADDGPVALIVPRPGRTAMMFISRPHRRSELQPLAQLVDAAVAELSPDQATLVQVLVDPDELLQTQALQQAGFDVLATLAYLQRAVPTDAPDPDLPQHAQLLSYTDQRRPLFVRALDESYEQTADCPALRGLRTTDDVLIGHMNTGRFDPNMWRLLLIDDQPAGVLLLNALPQTDCIELVYFGLAVQARGRGFGSLLMQHALSLCAASTQRLLTLAVDQDNAPAVKLYRRFGFHRMTRKLALMRALNVSR
jgi:GNAT superfamily N-acetyltransferase